METDEGEVMKKDITPDQPIPIVAPNWCGSCSELDAFDNFPFFNKNTTIDFPFIDTNTPNNVLAEHTPSESTEYIDMKSLVIPDCFSTSQIEVKDVPGPTINEQSNGDVLFVKEYTQRKGNLKVTKGSPIVERPPPRRNPKRQAQLKKPLSPSSPPASSNKGGNKEGTTRRTTRAGPASIKAAEFKQWPVDGMHEKPNFNPVTKRLEKLPASPATKRTRRRRKQNTDSNKQSDVEDQREFATCAHHNLHYVMMYLNNVKEYNAWTGRSNEQDNVIQATDLLKDACIMYCIANDVSTSSLAIYLQEVSSQENISEFLKNVLDDGETK